MTAPTARTYQSDEAELPRQTGELPNIHVGEAEDRTLPNPDASSERVSAILPENEPEDTLPDQLDNSR